MLFIRGTLNNPTTYSGESDILKCCARDIYVVCSDDWLSHDPSPLNGSDRCFRLHSVANLYL